MFLVPLLLQQIKVVNPHIAALKRARKLVEGGWIQGDFKRDDKYCSLGAMLYAGGDFEQLLSIFKKANRISNVSSWNDRCWRTKESVLRAFDRAIGVAS